MKDKLSRYAPAGIPLKKELFFYTLWLGLSILHSLKFVFHYCSERVLLGVSGNPSDLMEVNYMPDMIYFLGNSLHGFGLTAILMIFVAIYHYLYHFHGSKSIYLMKRLPQKTELFKRCVTLPLLGALCCLISAFLLLLLYYGFYMFATPKQYLAPDQWQKLWSVILCLK